MYVRTTGRPVVVVTTSRDTACVDAECRPLVERWGLYARWWAGTDSAGARRAGTDLLARAGRPLDLRAVPDGRATIVGVPANSVPDAGADAPAWARFRDAHGGAAGALRCSPAGFDPAGRTALVAGEWRCGPTCAHDLTVALRAGDDGTWAVRDMRLVVPPGRR